MSSYRSLLPVLYKPHIIAVAAVLQAGERLKLEIKVLDDRPLHDAENIDIEDVEGFDIWSLTIGC